LVRAGALRKSAAEAALAANSPAVRLPATLPPVELLVSDVPAWLVLTSAFAFGAIWGSFFNVAIYRWPREMSVVRPPSTCPHCQAPVAARYNVPILGYLFLRGRAACCGAPLSPRYPVVEALSGVLCLAIAHQHIVSALDETPLYQAALQALAYFAFVGGLIIATFVDLDFMEIPDEVSLPGAALGLATAVFRDQPGAEAAALGAGGGFLLIQLLFVWTYEHLTGRRGMGEGDSKLLMMIGAFLGWQGALFAVFAGAAQGLLTFVLTRITRMVAGPEDAAAASGDMPVEVPAAESGGGFDAGEPAVESAEALDDADDEPEPQYWGHFKLPFGPFLALGALEYLFFGDFAIDAWFRLMQG
jgi:leader peptidase (prepilin peptidase)/N-methyltransferase